MKYLYIILLAFTISSCEYNIEEIEIDCSETVSYINTIKPIIEANCFGCHNGDQTPNLSTFENVKENAERIKEETFSRRMPQEGSLTTEEVEAIYCWVKSGALNN